MRVLIVGAGVIGTVYGANLAAGGMTVSVLAHGSRAEEVARNGLVARDVLDDRRVHSQVGVVPDASAHAYDTVLVAVRRDQLASVLGDLVSKPFKGQPTLVMFGNNPAGRSAVPARLSPHVRLGFPGVGGVMVDGVAEYVRIPQQPTALEAGDDPRVTELAGVLRCRGFSVQRVADMDGWLAYHAVFVACLAAALYRCDTDPVRLSGDRETLKLMCQSVTEGFSALRSLGVSGLPRNLATLHSPLLAWFAVRYWARTMRSRMGELCFAAHARHAEAEMRTLADDVVARLGDCPLTATLRPLLIPTHVNASH
jgi:2-dehydropantoate 2-reductase